MGPDGYRTGLLFHAGMPALRNEPRFIPLCAREVVGAYEAAHGRVGARSPKRLFSCHRAISRDCTRRSSASSTGTAVCVGATTTRHRARVSWDEQGGIVFAVPENPGLVTILGTWAAMYWP